jgi:hypothetical protein
MPSSMDIEVISLSLNYHRRFHSAKGITLFVSRLKLALSQMLEAGICVFLFASPEVPTLVQSIFWCTVMYRLLENGQQSLFCGFHHLVDKALGPFPPTDSEAIFRKLPVLFSFQCELHMLIEVILLPLVVVTPSL